MFYKQRWGNLFAETLKDGKPDFEELLNPKTEDGSRRAKLLRETFKMDPQLMQQAHEQYGPLEWRLPEAHAIYWAYAGQQRAKKEDQVTLRRVIYQCMQVAFARGALLENRIDKTYALGPNLDIIPNASKSYEDMMAQEPNEAALHQTGHRNFLKKAIYHLYTFNRKREANRWFAYLKEKYPQAIPPNQSIDEYAVEQVTEDVGETNMDETTSVIRGLLVNSLLELAQDEDERAANYDLMAQRVWRRYTDKTALSEKRVGLPPFATIKQDVRDTLLHPETGVSSAMAAAIRTKLGLPPPPPPTNAPPTAPVAPQ
jgi:hypothetical protein